MNAFKKGILALTALLGLASCDASYDARFLMPSLFGENANDRSRSSASTLEMKEPPPGYLLDEWIDERGCVYVRIGDVEPPKWAPKVNRKGKHECGHPPFGEFTYAPGFVNMPEILGGQTTSFGLPHSPVPMVTLERNPDQFESSQGAQFGGIWREGSTTIAARPEPVISAMPGANAQPAPAPQALAAAPGSGTVQVGAFGDQRNVTRAINALTDNGYSYQILPLGALSMIRVTPKAGQNLVALQRAMVGLGFVDALIIGH